MTRIYTLAYDAASLRDRYWRLHGRMFSLRRQLPVPGLRRPEDYAELGRGLREVGSRVADLQADVDALAPADLGNRAPKETQAALCAYLRALGDSVSKLEAICTRLREQQHGERGATTGGAADLRRDKIGYDDAVQAHRRRGVRLQRLLNH